MIIKSLSHIEKKPVDMKEAENVLKQLPIARKDGTPLMSFRVFTLGPGGFTPYHRHPWEHINYVIEGEGALVDETGAEYALKKGDFALVLPDEKHRYRNTHPEKDFVMICAVQKEHE